MNKNEEMNSKLSVSVESIKRIVENDLIEPDLVSAVVQRHLAFCNKFDSTSTSIENGYITTFTSTKNQTSSSMNTVFTNIYHPIAQLVKCHIEIFNKLNPEKSNIKKKHNESFLKPFDAGDNINTVNKANNNVLNISISKSLLGAAIISVIFFIFGKSHSANNH